MSAFQVSDKHINAMLRGAGAMARRQGGLTWAPQLGTVRYGTLAGFEERIGQVLTDENARSVAHRYSEPAEEIAFSFNPFGPVPSAVETIKLCNCYRYQACETDDYEQTEAAAFINALRELAIACLPGYEAAPWEWNRAS